MDYYAKTDIGQLRQKNQDQAIVIANVKNQVLGLVCDGMGGHKAGEIASRLVMDHIVRCFKLIPPFIQEEEVLEWMRETIQQADVLVKKMAKGNKQQEGMGTTVVMSVMMDNTAFIGHVGDSRAYVLEQGQLCQITKDHTLVNALIDQGAITEEEAKNHAKKNVLVQAIGASSEIEPSFYQVKFDDTIVLLCSDGLYNTVEKEKIQEVLTKKISAKEKVDMLIDYANSFGGQDNIAVSIIESGGM